MVTLVNTGRVISAKRIGNVDSVAAVTYMCVGSGTDSENVTDTALASEYSDYGLTRATATVEYEADYKTKWSHEFTNSDSSPHGVNELGLANAATANGSDLYCRALLPATINILASGSAEFTVRSTHRQGS